MSAEASYEDVIEDRMEDADLGMYDEDGAYAGAEPEPEPSGTDEELREKLRYWRSQRAPSFTVPAAHRAVPRG